MDVVVATNRNHAYLRESLASVKAQTWPHWRVVVVDDGSPDPSALDLVVAGVPGARVVHQRSGGVSAARNRGLAEGVAPLVAFLDDDDIWRPDRLERQVRAWEAAPHHVAVHSAGWYIDAEGQPFGEGWRARQALSRRYLSGEEPLPRIVTLLVRRDICERVGGFDETLSLAEDNDFTLRLAQVGEFLSLDDALVGYRRHAGNVSAPGALAGRQSTERMLRAQIGRALDREDVAAALLLRENLRRFLKASAVEALHGTAGALRARDARTFAAELRWAGRPAPAAAAVRASAVTASQALHRTGWTSLRWGDAHR
ncbi:glycosyltransferase [Georgenia muralis]|uniref:glycosyltransferase n=1 Tax=Georgenia muralis TaxID=154117 RepID=UPI001476E91B|nr:glycosyltransferase [Georgenia muralis]